MTNGRYVLAIDLGTSGPKVALVSDRGEIVGNGFAPVDLHLLPGGGAEQDPDQWWDSIRASTRDVLASQLVPPEAITAVAVTGQWSGTVAVDARGQAIGNAVIWMDSRGARQIEDFVGARVRFQGYDPRKLRKWIQLTAGAPSGSGKDPIAHILYLREKHPDVYAATATFLEPKDYLNLRLTGKQAASFDSIALHWVTDNRDPSTVAYDDELLGYAGLTRDQLPELRAATDVLGGLTAAAAADLGLSPGLPVVMGTPDVHSAGIGAGTTADRSAHLYIGTSSWLSCHVPDKKTDLIHSIATLPAAIPGRYIVANEQETAGKALEWLAAILYPDATDLSAVYADMNEVAAAVPAGSSSVIFAPWLFGERTPVEDDTVRGGFFNQSLDTGRPELIRSVFEGVAYNSRWLLGYVERFVRTTLNPIVLVGGGAQSDLWCQIHADVLGRTVRQAADPLMVNVRGAGLLGHVALGHVGWAEIPSLVPITRSFRPNPAANDVYDPLYDAFRQIYKATRGIYRTLNR
jgi:xylulokinase